MIYVLPCGHIAIKYPDLTEREILLDHITRTQCQTCTQLYLQGERRKRNHYNIDAPRISQSCSYDPLEQACQT